ncbi:hypothetical protein IAT40_005661 [Kwoniella sp. CBS 6097]
MATPTASPRVTVETTWITPFPSSSYIDIQTYTYVEYVDDNGYLYSPAASSSARYTSTPPSASRTTVYPSAASASGSGHKTILSTGYYATVSGGRTASYYNAGITTDYSTYVSATAGPSGSYDQTYGYSQDSGINTTSIADMEGGGGSQDAEGGRPPLSHAAGIAIAVVAGLVVIGSVVGCCLYRRRRRRLNSVSRGGEGERSEKGFFGRAKRERGLRRSAVETTSWSAIDVPALPSPGSGSGSNSITTSPVDEYHHLQRSRSTRSGRRLSHRDLRHIVLSRPLPAMLYDNTSHSPTSATSLTGPSPFMDPPMESGSEAEAEAEADLHRTQSQFASEYDFNSRRSESTYTDGTEYDMLAHDGSSYARTLSTYSEGVNSEYSERDLGYLPPVSAGPGTGTGMGTGTRTSSTGTSTLGGSFGFGRIVGSSRDGDRKDPNDSDFGPGTSGSGSGSGDGTITSIGSGTLSPGWGRLPSTRTSPTAAHSSTAQYPPSRSLTPSYGNLPSANSHSHNHNTGHSSSTRPLLSISPTSPFADPSPTIATALSTSNPFENEVGYVPGSPASSRSWRTEDETLLRASNTLSSSQNRYTSSSSGRQSNNGHLGRGMTIVRHVDGGSANFQDEDDEENSLGGGRSGEMHLPPSYDDIYHTR